MILTYSDDVEMYIFCKALLRLIGMDLRRRLHVFFKTALKDLVILLFQVLPLCGGHTCTNINSISTVQKDTALLGSTFLTIPNIGVIGCARQCLLRRRCKSFNVALSSSECQLNELSTSGSVASNIVGVQNSVVSDIDQWSRRIAGACQNHACPNNSVCKFYDNGTLFCQFECSDPPRLTNGVISPNTTRYDIGTTLSYSCAGGYLRSGEAVCQSAGTWSNFSCQIGCQGLPRILNSVTGSIGNLDLWPVGSSPDITCSPTEGQIGKIRCQADGTWSTMKCVRVLRSCSEVRNCSLFYGDGEYWLFPEIFNNTAVKIFCSGMNSTTPKHYVTLPRETFSNYSDTSCRSDQFGSCVSIRYNKIRIDNIDTMTTGYKGLTDHTFANNSDCEVAEYAGAFDCSLDPSCTGNEGRQFKIDIGQTGLVISPETQWLVKSGYGNVTIQRSDNNRIINGNCVTNCSFCYVKDDNLSYILDESFTPSPSSASVPVCLASSFL
ncbi:uncharacterized protein LOC124124751 [Haliotis rufescens]|uniref:uncharacterized protein LOC124124751 n=1 Tax=Haliotis rufescens TaxID=6454 RepID=UPI00201F68DF|nr:uncharacterized protein LOC124124751 [Haliotis rufescens]